MGTKPDKDTGLWMVELDIGDDKDPHVAVIHIDLIFCTAHLVPVTRTAHFVNQSITMHTLLDTFELFYLNRFVDHNAFVSL